MPKIRENIDLNTRDIHGRSLFMNETIFWWFWYTVFHLLLHDVRLSWSLRGNGPKSFQKVLADQSSVPLRQEEKKRKKMTLDMDFYGVTILLYIQEKVPREVLIYSRSSKWPIQFGHLPANMSFIYQHHTRWHYHHNLWITLPIYWTKYRIFTNVSRSQFIEVIKSCRN